MKESTNTKITNGFAASMKKSLLLILCLATIGIGAWFGINQKQTAPFEISGFAFPEPSPLNGINLTNHDNNPLTEDSFKGSWTFIYVGYTFCPDACPMAMTVLNQLHGLLEKKNSNVSMMLVSVDPDRDTPEKLKNYVGHFNSSFSAATGSPDNIKVFANQVRSVYVLPQDRSDPNYIVDHSSSIILIDPNASVHAIFTPPQKASDLASDFEKINAQYNG